MQPGGEIVRRTSGELNTLGPLAPLTLGTPESSVAVGSREAGGISISGTASSGAPGKGADSSGATLAATSKGSLAAGTSSATHRLGVGSKWFDPLA